MKEKKIINVLCDKIENVEVSMNYEIDNLMGSDFGNILIKIDHLKTNNSIRLSSYEPMSFIESAKKLKRIKIKHTEVLFESLNKLNGKNSIYIEDILKYCQRMKYEI
jgi:hypothetical protein